MQGQTFEQWQELLQTELDPTIRTEAIRAFTLFGANGRGKEATEAIVNAVKGVDFRFVRNGSNDPVEKFKVAVSNAFSAGSVYIPIKDSLPIFIEKLTKGNKDEQTFVYTVWDPMRRHLDDDMAMQFLREAIRNNDAIGFQLYFRDFVPPQNFRMRATSRGEGQSQPPLLGLFPTILEEVEWHRENVQVQSPLQGPRIGKARFSTFGVALLELLRNEGLKSGNAAIRTRSQEVIDALSQIEELGKE